MKKNEGENRIGAAPVRPIRPTRIEFKSEAEMQRFVDYVISNRETKKEP
ncbi:hypothetical protein [Aneurinibacillus migulanus]|uniref:Uncharacterized protein n=1 Tax=Aneurinibacillus migulanus TaxID=47500 RepID=A0A1G8UCX4_ANEMI|nr:hypothetical protein [Aneurinibacillus migulanus]MED0896702.1 hypothetical protein [Aneurinibacillus migulanus]MED1619829.1 hypothetical protein [Aneurinibacillus migulanus]GED17414.1 hypothetical protein AMI01nite_54050 [Aneurinibacillus migulanus]SDJ51611.1 hypothetical protein SAMN04487909_11995 [Aneurinibacillus migulanus]